jgi:hypothetical protein
MLSKVKSSLNLDLNAINIMVRNMDANKTGETHTLIWEGQIASKNGELIARIYSVSDK